MAVDHSRVQAPQRLRAERVQPYCVPAMLLGNVCRLTRVAASDTVTC
jgi:hypothetical protein